MSTQTSPKEKWPILEYYRDGKAWRWRGSLLGDPGTADEFAQRMQAAFAETYEYLTEVHPKDAEHISRLTLKSNDVLEIETGGDDFTLKNKAGFSLIHVVGRYRPASMAEFSRAGKRKGSEAPFVPIQDTAAWKAASPRLDLEDGELLHYGLSRVMRSALRNVKKEPGRKHLSAVLLEKDGRDLVAVATDGHRMSVHRFLGRAALAKLDAKPGKALVPLPVMKELLESVLHSGRDFAGAVAFDLRRVGKPGTYAWTPETHAEEAWEGVLSADGYDYPVPILDPEKFPNWRAVLPAAGDLAWHLAFDAAQAASTLEALWQDWRAVFLEKHGRAPKAKDLPVSVRCGLSSGSFALSFDDPRREGAFLNQEVPTAASKGLKQPLPVLLNPKYLADALGTMGGDCLLSGFPSDTSGRDGGHYISKPLVFSDNAGPTLTLLMPMWPPR